MMHRYLKSSWAAAVILVFIYLGQCKIKENKDSADGKLSTVYCSAGLSRHLNSLSEGIIKAYSEKHFAEENFGYCNGS